MSKRQNFKLMKQDFYALIVICSIIGHITGLCLEAVCS